MDPEGSNPSPIRFLVVDDEPLAVERLQLLLARIEGVTVAGTASEGAAALRLVLVSGESKAKIVREARDGVDHPIVRATSGLETWWLIDKEAARNIE